MFLPLDFEVLRCLLFFLEEKENVCRSWNVRNHSSCLQGLDQQRQDGKIKKKQK